VRPPTYNLRDLSDDQLETSLLPVPFHPAVAELCIQHRKHLVTASYISPAMRALHDRSVQKLRYRLR
jgi:alpha-aminoadipic semialdehyde synthase